MLHKPECKVGFVPPVLIIHVICVSSFTQYTLLQVEFDMEGKVCGVTSEGETAKCKKVVCDPSYLPNKVDITVFS
jgi:hypothetical protein